MQDDEPLEIIGHEDAISAPGSPDDDVLEKARNLWVVTAEKVLSARRKVTRLMKQLKDAKEGHNSLMIRCQGLSCLFDRAEAERMMEDLARKAGEIDGGN